MRPPARHEASSEPALDLVLSDATARGLPVLLVFHTVWCKPCAVLEKEVLANAEVLRVLAGYRVQKYDAELDEGAAAAQRFQVSSYPTLLVLSPEGTEIARVHEQDVPGLVRALTGIHEAALHAPIPDEAVAREPDAHTLLVTGQIRERERDLPRARRAYQAAIMRDKASSTAIGSTAAFLLARLDARAEDSRNHRKALLRFAAQFPASSEARSARAAAELPTEIAARDSTGATSTTSVLGADPFAGACDDSDSAPVEFMTMMRRSRLIGRRLVEACRQEFRNEEEQEVRLYVKDGQVERALLLDPEAPEPLRRCIEAHALLERDLPPLFGARRIVTARFGPTH